MNIRLSDNFTYRKLLRFTLPSMVMMIFTSIYGVVDGFFVSNYVGKTPFAAINLIMPFLMMLGAVGFMIGAGGSALVAMTLGKGDDKKANSIFSLLIYIVIGTGLLFSLLGIVFTEPVAVFLGASGEMLPYCVEYGRVILLALVPFMLQNVFQSFLITAERPTLGLVVTTVSGCANMLLDWLFMAVLQWGITGAAYATAAAQVIGGVIPLVYFILPNNSRLRLGRTSLDKKAIGKACLNGSSEFMTNISMSIVSMIYNFQLMKYAGEDGVSAYGVLMYVGFIFIAAYLGFSVGSAPIVGYHYGAKNSGELKELFRKSLIIIGIMTVVLFALAELFARPISMIFVNYDAGLLEMTVGAFRIHALSFIVSGFNIYGSGFFTALNNGLISALISFGRTLVFQVIAVLLLPMILGTEGIWFAGVAAEGAAIVLTVFCFIKKRKDYNYA
ncbi:MAG: MATE family efflux transporter [Ruminiclostridium sp.]|nr:MATE family efflux transporter [Ruminiclostridium sp.]